MKKTLIYILFLVAAAVPAFAQDTVAFRPGKVIPMEGSFLDQLEARDSILIADQVEYGFTIKDVHRGDILLLEDLPEPGYIAGSSPAPVSVILNFAGSCSMK